jgi:putative membrane-bound dehydrogenase-like protein
MRIVSACVILAMLIKAAAADGPAPPDEAAQRFTLPAGFSATLFAGEPDLVQPIAFTFDDRGRLWVVENHSYPGWADEKKDRVLIFEDRDGDGRFDERTVFLDNGSNLSGIEWGFGGVWLCSTPNLVFVPDRDADDVPDGPPVVKLDGWDPKAQHNVSSSLAWGPDGWLYGCNGILSNSNVGKPEATPADRTPMNCGVWRYHPVRETFEVVAHGTTNPWGLDFDQYGQTFFTNCVIAHAWHAVPGARFQRMFGQDFNPHSYALMATCADHLHWAGGAWQEARGGERHDSHGGGHAHVGAMVYLGDNWPEEYRNGLFTCNLHGNRVNHDSLQRQGSGYVAEHEPDVVLTNDPWFRGMTIKYGPDGGVFVSDWTDTGECHNYEVVDRTNGRIYKVTHGKTQPWSEDLAKLGDAELIQRLTHKNEWVARHARRILQERAANKTLGSNTPSRLVSMLGEQSEAVPALEVLWALHAVGASNEPLLLGCMDSPHDVVRGWAVQLEVEDRQASPQVLVKLAQLAASDPSPWVRLALASALQRLPLADRWGIAERLVAHGEDANDANLPLMYWYAIEPLVPADPARALHLAAEARLPIIRKYIVRRLASTAEAASLASIVQFISAADDSLRPAALAGLLEALQGRREVAMPAGWSELYARLSGSAESAVREPALLLALTFGDPQALAELRRTAAESQAAAADRNQAIRALLQAGVTDLSELLQSLLADPAVRIAALRGLSVQQHPATPTSILQHYAEFDAAARQEAVSALASRREYALALFDALEQGAVLRGDVSAFHVQQLQNLHDAEVDGRLAKAWGAVRATPADRAAAIARHKARLTPEVLASANLSHGRALFEKSCAACHRLFDAGGAIGPELTGSQRANLDYVLSNVLDPSAIVAKDFQLTVFQTADGRVLSGIVAREDEHSVAVQTATELVAIPKDEIEAREPSEFSMMPDQLLEAFSDDDVRDLAGYLASPHQVPLSASEGGQAPFAP